ncbi:hypothetical protein [Bosea sp. RAC05]|uniref:hypothetical protein n=1 Tax=Bosea sp. RAC05 TaxID=1842539 RepID=UPI00083E4E80|nr:hypothetical protein [Bosea sp. RAC05]
MKPIIPTVPAWSALELRSVEPSYTREPLAPTRADLRNLGCSEETIEHLFPNPKTEGVFLDPSEWFWKDRAWFKHTPPDVMADIARISGGFFSDLSLTDQAQLLGVEIRTIPGERVRGERGKWRSAAGLAVDIEEFALEALLQPGERGTWNEGKSLNAFHLLTAKVFEKMHGHWIGFEETNRRPYTASAAYTQKVLAAARSVLDDPRSVYFKLQSYFDHLMKAPISEVERFIDVAGPEHILRVLDHGYTNGTRSMSGHPDITIRGEGLRFIEVKHRDRLHGNQADWILSVAKPLGLDVEIIRVADEKGPR